MRATTTDATYVGVKLRTTIRFRHRGTIAACSRFPRCHPRTARAVNATASAKPVERGQKLGSGLRARPAKPHTAVKPHATRGSESMPPPTRRPRTRLATRRVGGRNSDYFNRQAAPPMGTTRILT